MGVFPCGFCDKVFPFMQRLKDHLKVHGLTKPYLVNRQIAEWVGSIIPSVQAPEEPKECSFCKKGFHPKNLAAHMRRCAQKGKVALAPEGTGAADAAPEPEGAVAANGGVQETQGGAGNASGEVEAANAASEPQDGFPTSKGGLRAGFHKFLVSRNVALKSITGFMALFDQWIELCGEEEAHGTVLIEKFPQFIDQQPSNWKKQEAFRLYSQFCCYISSLFESFGPHGITEFKLVDGKAVPAKEKAYISRPRVLSSRPEGNSQHSGRGCRDRKKTEPYNVPKPVKAVKNPRAKPSKPLAPVEVDEDQSTPANQTPPVSISQGSEQQNPGIIRDVQPYQKKRGKVTKADWFDEDGNPHWYDEDDDEEWGKGKGKGKGGKGKRSEANAEFSDEDSD